MKYSVTCWSITYGIAWSGIPKQLNLLPLFYPLFSTLFRSILFYSILHELLPFKISALSSLAVLCCHVTSRLILLSSVHTLPLLPFHPYLTSSSIPSIPYLYFHSIHTLPLLPFHPYLTSLSVPFSLWPLSICPSVRVHIYCFLFFVFFFLGFITAHFFPGKP